MTEPTREQLMAFVDDLWNASIYPAFGMTDQILNNPGLPFEYKLSRSVMSMLMENRGLIEKTGQLHYGKYPEYRKTYTTGKDDECPND